MKFNYGKIFLLGFGFFGVSVIWGVYNAFVPIFLANKFHLTPAFIRRGMVRSVAHAHRTTTSIHPGWRADHCPRVWIYSTRIGVAFIRRMHKHIIIKRSLMAHASCGSDAGYHAL